EPLELRRRQRRVGRDDGDAAAAGRGRLAGLLVEQLSHRHPVDAQLSARAEVREQEDADGVLAGESARRADAALPVEAAHPGSGAVENGGAGRNRQRRRDHRGHAGPLDRDMADGGSDVGDRVPRPGVERADHDAVLARAWHGPTLMLPPFVWNDDCLLHQPMSEIWVGERTPATEVPARARAIREALVAAGAEEVSAEPHDDEALFAVHDPALVEFLRTAWEEWSGADLPSERVVPYIFARAELTSGR